MKLAAKKKKEKFQLSPLSGKQTKLIVKQPNMLNNFLGKSTHSYVFDRLLSLFAIDYNIISIKYSGKQLLKR